MQNHRRIAVIAVHGVGDAQPFETARSVAALLQTSGSASYASFQEHALHLDVPPLVRPQHGPRRPTLFQRLSQPAQVNAGNVDEAFMEGQLEPPADGPPIPGSHYRTVKLQGPLHAQRNVDVYELFWSDLSSVGSGLVKVLAELFQLLFHVPRLGAHTVTSAALCQKNQQGQVIGAWRRYAWLQNTTTQMLSRVLPLANLVALVLAIALTGVALVTHSYRTYDASLVAGAVLGLLGLGGMIFYLSGRGKNGNSHAPFFLALAGFPALTAAVIFGLRPAEYSVEMLFGTALLLAAFSASRTVAKIFARRFERSDVWYDRLAPIGLIGCLASGWNSGKPALVYYFKCFDTALFLLAILWIGFFAAALATLLFSAFAQAPNPFEGDKVKRAKYTARVTLGFPAFLFIGISISFWSLLAGAAKNLFSPVKATYFSLILWRPVAVGGASKALLDAAGAQLVPLLTLLLLLVAALGLWALGPAVKADILAPKQPSPAQSIAGGTWLTDGYKLLWVSLEIVYWGLLSFGFWQIAQYAGWHQVELPLAGFFQLTTLQVSAAGMAGVLAILSRLTKLTKALRPTLKASLDVDNWLREQPAGENPTAQICARYFALLQYIDDGAYDAIVISAHSQGTAITADFLRYLKRKRPHFLSEKKIYLLTYGCPLRQLYALRFPHLYGWVRDAGHPQITELLQVEAWVNAYRSEDYIGRSVWHEAQSPGSWAVGPIALPPALTQATEVCLPAGAHTHYLDHTSSELRSLLDQLIRSA